MRVHALTVAPVMMLYTRHVLLLEAATAVLQSGLTANAVIGSESCRVTLHGEEGDGPLSVII